MTARRGRTGRPAGHWVVRLELFRIFKDAFFVGAALVGLASGLASLLVTGDLGRVGIVALRGIAVVCVLYVIVRLVHALLIQEKQELERRKSVLEAKLTAAREELDSFHAEAELQRSRYLGAVTRLVDRQTLLYEEELEVTITIGDNDDSDEIVERHITTPTPYLFYRSMRPIVPRELLVPPNFADLDIKVRVEKGDGVMPTVLPMVETGPFVRVLIIFEPPVDRPLIWTLRYRPHGMWRPLRRDGVDCLEWDARTPRGRPNESTYKRFMVRFRYPQQAPVLMVRERGSRGRITSDAGDHAVTWSEESPVGTIYEWDLAMHRSVR